MAVSYEMNWGLIPTAVFCDDTAVSRRALLQWQSLRSFGALSDTRTWMGIKRVTAWQPCPDPEVYSTCCPFSFMQPLRMDAFTRREIYVVMFILHWTELYLKEQQVRKLFHQLAVKSMCQAGSMNSANPGPSFTYMVCEQTSLLWYCSSLNLL